MGFFEFLDKLTKKGNDANLPPINVDGSTSSMNKPQGGARIPRPPISESFGNSESEPANFNMSFSEANTKISAPPTFNDFNKQVPASNQNFYQNKEDSFPNLPKFRSVLEKPEKGGDVSPKLKRHNVSGPLFVKLDDYRRVIADIDLILNDLKEENNLAVRLNSIKNGLDTQFDKWHSEMEDLQRKLVFIDKTLFEELL